jgi:hypothetical protein
MAGKQPGQVARFACSGIFQPSDPPRIDLKLLNTTASKEHRQRSATASEEDFVKLMSWVLGAVLTTAPIMYAQTQDQQQPTNPPASSVGQSSSPSTGQAGQSSVPQPSQAPAAQVANQTTMPQSDQDAQTNSSVPADQDTIYGTGMTVAELKQAGYSDGEIAQMRTDSQMLMAANNKASTGTASGNQDQAPSAANGVSQPSDTNNNANAQPAQAQVNNHAGLWGLLGLLGLLGLAGRARQRTVVRHEEVDTTAADRDRVRMMARRDAVERAANRDEREREIAAANEQRTRSVADAERDRMPMMADHDAAERAARERDLAIARKYDDQDIVSENDMENREMQDEQRGRKVMDIVRDRERNRRRTA